MGSVQLDGLSIYHCHLDACLAQHIICLLFFNKVGELGWNLQLRVSGGLLVGLEQDPTPPRYTDLGGTEAGGREAAMSGEGPINFYQLPKIILVWPDNNGIGNDWGRPTIRGFIHS